MMWRDEAGMLEMLLTYIGECENFSGWSSWRRVLVEILSCHEEAKQSGRSLLSATSGDPEYGSKQTKMKAEGAEERSWSPLEHDADVSAAQFGDPVFERRWRLSLSCMDAAEAMVENKMKDEDGDDEVLITMYEPSRPTEETPVAAAMRPESSSSAVPGCHQIRSDETPTCHSSSVSSNQQKLRDCVYPSPMVLSGSAKSTYPSEDDRRHQMSNDVLNANVPMRERYTLNAGDRGTRIRIRSTPHQRGTEATSSSFHTSKTLSLVCSKIETERGDSKAKPYQCSYCLKRFSLAGNKNLHERSHTGEKPYKCSYCPTRFTRNRSKILHERAHTGERPYKCSYCPKAFSRRETQTEHERIHTGATPFKCSYCPLVFRQRSARSHHERLHISRQGLTR